MSFVLCLIMGNFVCSLEFSVGYLSLAKYHDLEEFNQAIVVEKHLTELIALSCEYFYLLGSVCFVVDLFYYD